MDEFDQIERDITKRANRKFYAKHRRMEPLGYCDCGTPIYKADKDGIPYRQCWKCATGQVQFRGT